MFDLRFPVAAVLTAALAAPAAPARAAPVGLMPPPAGLPLPPEPRFAPEALLIPAQSEGETPGYRENPAESGPTAATGAYTAQIVLKINDSTAFCSAIPMRYRIDCLRHQFRRIAHDLPRTGDYAPVRRALLDAAGDLERIVGANSAGGERQRFRSSAGAQAQRTPPLTPVAPARMAAASRAADAVIAEAQTVLLRSAENSARRQVHYQELARAIDSTKVLLRSA